MNKSFQIDEIKWPCELPDSVKRKLLSLGQYCVGIEQLEITKSYAKFPGIFYILGGSVGLCTSTNDMKNIVGGFMGATDWLGALTFGTDVKIFTVAEEIQTLEMLLFPKEKVMALAEEEPLVYKWLFRCGQGSQRLWLQALITSLHEKEQKVVYSLLELAKRQSLVEGAIKQVNISQSQLSMVSGVSRPRLNEVLKIIEESGAIIVKRGRIYLSDREKLQRLLDSMNLMLLDPRAG